MSVIDRLREPDKTLRLVLDVLDDCKGWENWATDEQWHAIGDLKEALHKESKDGEEVKP